MIFISEDDNKLEESLTLDLLLLSQARFNLYKYSLRRKMAATKISGKIVGIINEGDEVNSCTLLIKSNQNNYFAADINGANAEYIAENRCVALYKADEYPVYFNNDDEVLITIKGYLPLHLGMSWYEDLALNGTQICKQNMPYNVVHNETDA